jgi:predicted small metal-binding protein
VAKEVVCPPCGEVLRGENDDELVAVVVSHAKGHGHEIGEANREEILSTAYEV